MEGSKERRDLCCLWERQSCKLELTDGGKVGDRVWEEEGGDEADTNCLDGVRDCCTLPTNVWIVVFFQRWPYVGGLCAMISNHWYKIKLIRQIVHLPGSCRAQATYQPLVKSRKRKANLMSAWPEMGCECCVACFMDGQRSRLNMSWRKGAKSAQEAKRGGGESVHKFGQKCKRGLWWSHTDSIYAGATNLSMQRKRWLWWNPVGSIYARASVQGRVRREDIVVINIQKDLAFNWIFLVKSRFLCDIGCEVNSQAIAKGVKRETAPSSESAQFILAWRSEDSVESAKSSQSEAQPDIGSSAILEAARHKTVFFLLQRCAHHDDSDSLGWMTSLCIKCYTPKKGEIPSGTNNKTNKKKPPQTTNTETKTRTQVFPLMWNSETSSQWCRPGSQYFSSDK